MTIAEAMRPVMHRRSHEVLYDLGLAAAGSVLVALSAQVAVALPFSPVPVTGQTLAVLTVGMLLGARRGALSLILYVAEGAAGLPVFAGGSLGLARLVGPTAGYLVGFILAAWAAGWLAERGWDRTIPRTALAMILGNAIIYLFGLLWLGAFVGGARVLQTGLYPFLAGDAIKVVLAMLALPAGWRMLGTSRRN